VTWFLLCVGAFALVVRICCEALAVAVRCVACALGLPLTNDRTKEGS